MSYAHNNHYEWIEKCYNLKCSELGKEVANIIGWVGRGIYNAPCDTKKINWTDNHCIELNWSQALANYDGQQLTDLVIECHRRMIRVSIQPNMRYLKMMFWKRTTRSFQESIFARMPDIEYMIQKRDEYFNNNN